MTKIAFIAVLVISIIVGIGAILANPSHSLTECFLKTPDCSTAVSTYALVMFGALAFIAAVNAGNWARMTLEHERAPVVSIDQCNATCSERRCDERYIFDVHAGFVEVEPNQPGIEFQPYDFDVHNLGKIALGDLRATVRFKRQDGTESKPLAIQVGAVASGARLHARIFIDARLLDQGNFVWHDAAGNLPRLGKSPQRAAVELFTSSKKLRVPVTEKWQSRLPQPQVLPQSARPRPPNP